MAPRSAPNARESREAAGYLVKRTLDVIAAANGTLQPSFDDPVETQGEQTTNCPPAQMGRLELRRDQRWGYVPPSWIAQRLAVASTAGTYGQVFLLNVDRGVHDTLTALRPALKQRIDGVALPRAGGRLAVKIQVIGSARNANREAHLHRYLAASRTPIVIKPDQCAQPGVSVTPSEHVPVFYFAGIVPLDCLTHTEAQRVPILQAKRNVHITVMQDLSTVAQTLDSVLEARQPMYLGAIEYASIERAAAALWLAGVYHADLHSGNILVAHQHAYIIDFGFAVAMTGAQRQRVGAAVASMFEGVTLANVYDNVDRVDAQRHVDQTIMGRWTNHHGRRARGGYPRYYADKTLLQHYYSMVQQKSLVIPARKSLWKCLERAPSRQQSRSSTEPGEIRVSRRKTSPPKKKTPSPPKKPASIIDLTKTSSRQPSPRSAVTALTRTASSVINLVSSNDERPGPANRRRPPADAKRKNTKPPPRNSNGPKNRKRPRR